MTLSIKHRHEEDKKLLDKELVRRLNSDTVILIILSSCIGVVVAIIVPLTPGFTPPLSSIEPSLPATDFGSVVGFVMSSDGVAIEGASVAIYKHMPLIYSADKNTDYIDYVLTESDGSYSFDNLPSGVYRFTVTYPDRVVQIIDNYAVWSGSSSSHVFAAE
jgi:Carboxypeptidase regulatory-like domain